MYVIIVNACRGGGSKKCILKFQLKWFDFSNIRIDLGKVDKNMPSSLYSRFQQLILIAIRAMELAVKHTAEFCMQSFLKLIYFRVCRQGLGIPTDIIRSQSEVR